MINGKNSNSTLPNEKGQVNDWDVFKNDVFALGLTLLSAAILKPTNALWN